MFDVLDISNNSKVGNLCIGDQQWECISGKYGKGSLPSGIYNLNECYRLECIEGKTEAYTGKKFAWVAKLKPQFETDRTGLLIHPDGNKEGTLGCIGISKKEDDSEVFWAIKHLLKDKKELTVLVNK